MNIVQFLSGKKTYLTSIAIFILLFGQWQGWWKIDQNVYLALTAAAVAFLRAGVAKGPTETNSTAKPTSVARKLTGVPLMGFACLGLICGIGALATGCSTATPQQITYQAAGTTVVTVDAAMKEWGAYVQAEHPSAAEEAAVRAAYDKYQAAMAAACDAGAIYASTASTNAPAASLALNQAVANASQELSDLENLISSFGLKLQ